MRPYIPCSRFAFDLLGIAPPLVVLAWLFFGLTGCGEDSKYSRPPRTPTPTHTGAQR